MPPFQRLLPLPRRLPGDLAKPVAIGVGLATQLPMLAVRLGTQVVVTGYGLVTSLLPHSDDPQDEPFPSYQGLDTSAWGAADTDAEVVQLFDREQPPITIEPGLVAAVEDRASTPATDPARQDLPIEGYDGLSAAALRARVSGLSRSELTTLRDYEAGHAKRVTVLALLERQRAKA